MLEGFWEVYTGYILPLDRWGNGRKGSRQIVVGEASRGLASAPVVAKEGSVQIVVEVTHTQSVHEVKNISPESLNNMFQTIFTKYLGVILLVV